jgi:hypothetical protein
MAKEARQHMTRNDSMAAGATVDKLLYDRKSAASALSISIRSLDYLIAKGELRSGESGRKCLCRQPICAASLAAITRNTCDLVLSAFVARSLPFKESLRLIQMKEMKAKNIRGIYERPEGSNVWWVCWFDAGGRRHREKAGSKATAIKLKAKRTTDKLEARKIPETLRHIIGARLSELCEDVLHNASTRMVRVHSATSKVSSTHYRRTSAIEWHHRSRRRNC